MGGEVEDATEGVEVCRLEGIVRAGTLMKGLRRDLLQEAFLTFGVGNRNTYRREILRHLVRGSLCALLLRWRWI